MTPKFPGVYELLIREPKGSAPRSIGVTNVENSNPGVGLTYKGRNYTIVNRSGLPPTGQLLIRRSD
jgi:hypothetical protein